MDESTHKIRQLAEDAERKRDAAYDRAEKARHDGDRHAAEAEAYRKVLALMGDKPKGGDTAEPAASVRQRKSGRSLSGKWTDIYKALHKMGGSPYSYDDINAAVDVAGHEVSMGGLRTQMMNAVNAGVFERVGAGKFAFTDDGLKAIDAKPAENGASAEAPEANAGSAEDTSGVLNLNPNPSREQDERGNPNVDP